MLPTLYLSGKVLVNVSAAAVHFRKHGPAGGSPKKKEDDWQLGDKTYKKQLKKQVLFEGRK